MTSALPASARGLINALYSPELLSSAIHNPALDQTLAEVKAEAVSRNDQIEASGAWRAETIAAIQKGFIAAFAQLKHGNFYPAWCQLEQCELALKRLRHHHSVTKDDPHRLDYIDRMIGCWQELYPYRIFFSPEFLKKKIRCSICGKVISPRLHCGHEKGMLYGGEHCHHIVTEAELLSISVVENPVQRYSVAFLSNEDGSQRDHYNYDTVKFVVDRVASPFHGWRSERTTRTLPASTVAHLSNSRPCPCISGKDFGICCAGRDEITVPHLQINFCILPPKELPTNELLF